MKNNLRSRQKTRLTNSQYPSRYFVTSRSMWNGEEWTPIMNVYRTSKVFTKIGAWEYRTEAGEYFTNKLPQLDGITFINYHI